jgi:hypothetical protein
VIPPVRCPVSHLVTTVPRPTAVNADSAGARSVARPLPPVAIIGTAWPFQGWPAAGCGLPTAEWQAAMFCRSGCPRTARRPPKWTGRFRPSNRWPSRPRSGVSGIRDGCHGRPGFDAPLCRRGVGRSSGVPEMPLYDRCHPCHEPFQVRGGQRLRDRRRSRLHLPMGRTPLAAAPLHTPTPRHPPPGGSRGDRQTRPQPPDQATDGTAPPAPERCRRASNRPGPTQ